MIPKTPFWRHVTYYHLQGVWLGRAVADSGTSFRAKRRETPSEVDGFFHISGRILVVAILVLFTIYLAFSLPLVNTYYTVPCIVLVFDHKDRRLCSRATFLIFSINSVLLPHTFTNSAAQHMASFSILALRYYVGDAVPIIDCLIPFVVPFSGEFFSFFAPPCLCGYWNWKIRNQKRPRATLQYLDPSSLMFYLLG